ncbi:MAG: hypothetical protein JW810_14480 [Sedimentisphaerales bacterium]|nr:hypothetical protein [Sedimentisphaerales bacterium]
MKLTCDSEVLEMNAEILNVLLNSSLIIPTGLQERISVEVSVMGRSNLFRLNIFEIPLMPQTDPAAALGEPHPEMYDMNPIASEPEPGLANLEPAASEEAPQEAEPEQGDLLTLPPADKITWVADRLRAVLRTEYEKQLDQYRQKLELAEKELVPLREQMRELTDAERALFVKTGIADLRREKVLEKIQFLEDRRQDLEMQQVESRALVGALEDQLAKMAEQAKEKLAQDPIAKELEGILEIRRHEFELVQKMQEQGQASREDVLKAQEGLARARIELVQRREAVAETIGGVAAIQKWNEELASVAMKNAEAEAGLKYVNGQLQQYRDKKILEEADMYELYIGLKMETVRKSYNDKRNALLRYQNYLQQATPPAVSVLGAD